MRKLTVNSLQFSFTDKVNWNIKPMIKMKKVSFRGGKKIVSEFYGELVEFENMGLWLMLPAKEIVEFDNYNKNRNIETYQQLRMQLETVEDNSLDWVELPATTQGKQMRIKAASEGLKLKKGFYYMGKCPVTLYYPLKLQGCTAVLVQYKEEY